DGAVEVLIEPPRRVSSAFGRPLHVVFPGGRADLRGIVEAGARHDIAERARLAPVTRSVIVELRLGTAGVEWGRIHLVHRPVLQVAGGPHSAAPFARGTELAKACPPAKGAIGKAEETAQPLAIDADAERQRIKANAKEHDRGRGRSSLRVE